MAQAHELLGGATVAELVESTLQSLQVAKPAGVNLKSELPAGAVRLRPERAASLALAMHELCFNGIVHGLPNGGTLKIRAAQSDGDLVVEVEDDGGTGAAAAEPIEQRDNLHPGGIGLDLVRGLVGRELRGKFTLQAAPGGSIATLRIPLLADENSPPPIYNEPEKEGAAQA